MDPTDAHMLLVSLNGFIQMLTYVLPAALGIGGGAYVHNVGVSKGADSAAPTQAATAAAPAAPQPAPR